MKLTKKSVFVVTVVSTGIDKSSLFGFTLAHCCTATAAATVTVSANASATDARGGFRGGPRRPQPPLLSGFFFSFLNNVCRMVHGALLL